MDDLIGQAELRILLLEDNPFDADVVQYKLRESGLRFTARRVETRDAFISELEGFKPDIVLADYKLPAFDGASAIKIVRQQYPHIPVVMVTGVAGDEKAVELLKLGARDYVLKDRLARLGPAVLGAIREEQGIRERKLAETRIHKLARLYATLNNTNQIVVRAPSRKELFARICESAVIHGKFAMAWIGLIDEAAHTIKLECHSGVEENRLADIFTSASAIPADQCMASIAIRENRTCHINDFAASEALQLRCENLLKYGFCGGAALPLRAGGKAIGALTLYTNEHGFFDTDQMALLEEMANDIGFALDNLEREAERITAERKLAESERHFRAVTESASDAIITITGAGNVMGWNAAAARMFGYAETEIAGKSLAALVPERFRERHSAGLVRAALGGVPHLTGRVVELAGLRKDGSEFPLELSLAQWETEEGQFFTAIIRDITERKRAEALLQESEERYRRIIEELTDYQYTVRVENGQAAQAALSAACEEVTGYTPAEFAASPDLWIQMVIPMDRELVEERVRQAQAGNEGLPLEYRIIRKDGVLRWIRNTIILLKDDTGKLLSYNGVISDITERKRHEELTAALLNIYTVSESLDLNAALQQGLDTIEHLTNSKIGFLHFVNEGEEEIELVTWSSGTLGRYCNAVYGQHYPVSAAGIWADCIRSKHPIIINDYATVPGRKGLPQGHALLQRFISAPIMEGDKVRMIIGVGNAAKHYDEHDTEIVSLYGYTLYRIVQRKRAEKMLQESEGKFRHLAENLDELIYCANPQTLAANYVSPAIEKMCGFTAEEWIADPSLREKSIHPDDRQRVIGEIEAARREYRKVETEYRILCKDDSERWVLDRAIWERDQEGAIVAMNGVMYDITERKRSLEQQALEYRRTLEINTQLIEANRQLKQAKDQLLQSEKMASIGLLAAGVAHEINNPVGYVNSNLGTLEKYSANLLAILDKYEAAEAVLEANNPAFEEIREFKKKHLLDRIRKDIGKLLDESRYGLERVRRIVLDLKNFSRIDRDEQWVLADVHEVLEATLNVVWNELKYKCKVVREYGALQKIHCLPMQLGQVFMNLLVNAAQAIAAHGTITLRTGQEDGRIWVEVSDTGAGIPPENMPRLFDPFFTTKPVGKGTGLGLTVTYNIVEKHGGKIEVQSEPGKGASFRVWLPVRQAGA